VPTLRTRNGSGPLGCVGYRTRAMLVGCSRRDYGRRCEVPSDHVDNDSWSRSRDLRGPRVQQAVHFVSILPNTGACGFGVAPDVGGGCHRVRGCTPGRYDFVALIESFSVRSGTRSRAYSCRSYGILKAAVEFAQPPETANNSYGGNCRVRLDRPPAVNPRTALV
jgi:hypothetical protein